MATTPPPSAKKVRKEELQHSKPFGNLNETKVSDTPSALSDTHPETKTAKKKVRDLGDFKLLKKLGKGGMGEVYLATQLSLDRKVAVKVLTRHLAKREKFVARFMREARAMGKIDHPNIVKCFYAGTDHGLNYAAIEYVDGFSLQDRINKRGCLDIGDALFVVVACCEALKFAHGKNLIHRDIKPDNILVTKDGAVKVADFGLAKVLDDDIKITQTGIAVGTPLFMSLEQAKNPETVDHRTDIYSLGCTLYYLLTGKLPYKGETPYEVSAAQEKGVFTPARRINHKIPERLDMILSKMLMKDPDHRYANCDSILADIDKLGRTPESLSFVESDEKAVLVRSRSSETAMPKPHPRSKTDVKLPTSQTKDKEDVWYVKHKNAKGQDTVSRFTSEQIVKLVKSDTIDNEAQAKRDIRDPFLPLGQYPEFASLAEQRVVRTEASRKKSRVSFLLRR